MTLLTPKLMHMPHNVKHGKCNPACRRFYRDVNMVGSFCGQCRSLQLFAWAFPPAGSDKFVCKAQLDVNHSLVCNIPEVRMVVQNGQILLSLCFGNDPLLFFAHAVILDLHNACTVVAATALCIITAHWMFTQSSAIEHECMQAHASRRMVQADCMGKRSSYATW